MTSKAKITMEAKEISKTITKAKGIIKMIRICHPKTMTPITKVISMEILMDMILIKVMTNQIWMMILIFKVLQKNQKRKRLLK